MHDLKNAPLSEMHYVMGVSCPGFVINGTYGDLGEISKQTRKHKSNIEYTEIHNVGKSKASFLIEKMENKIQQTSKGKIG